VEGDSGELLHILEKLNSWFELLSGISQSQGSIIELYILQRSI